MIHKTKKTRKTGIIEWCMRYHNIVLMVVGFLMVFGIFGLQNMKKNEFPDFTIRQGVVVAAYPGATAQQLEDEVAKPLEDYIFSYKEVNKKKTTTTCQDGMVMMKVQLNDELNDKEAFWAKFKHGINTFKSQLPSGVLAVIVNDDFGDASALLITMESEDKTYRELSDYMDDLKDRLRSVESVGRMTVSGMQKEQISVVLDADRLSHYALNEQTLAINLMTKGFTTTGGTVKTGENDVPIYVSRSFNSLRDVQDMIVMSTPDGQVVRLKDIADVKKEYPKPASIIENNGKKCLLLSIEMKKGKDIVAMGKEVKEILADFQETLPKEVSTFTITDQSKVVGDSIENFLHELIIAIVAVVIVVMLLMPMRVALVAASTIPISIFISLGLFSVMDLELNTVTLAALVVTLGMIVDNSIVIIDSYLERIADGQPRWQASIDSAAEFFKSIFSATLAISITFFPFLLTTTGQIHDFLLSFPWSVSAILLISLLVAEFVVPFLQYRFITRPVVKKEGSKPSALDRLQARYESLVDWCFDHKRTVMGIGAGSIAAGIFLMTLLHVTLMPRAERNQFAVEIYMPTGTSLERTGNVADSLAHILKKDSRIVSVAVFKGTSSPRFSVSYAPQMGGSNYAQFIVNTTGDKETRQLLNEYAPQYSTAFTGAVVKFKELDYNEAANPIEVRISGNNYSDLKTVGDSVLSILHADGNCVIPRTDFSEPLPAVRIDLDEDGASRLGITNLGVESALAMQYGSGITIGSEWDHSTNSGRAYDIPVVLRGNKADSAALNSIEDAKLVALGGIGGAVPLRQVAKVTPIWQDGKLQRRNGIRTLTVIADLKRGVNATEATDKVIRSVSRLTLPEGVSISYGGTLEHNNETGPTMAMSLLVATLMIFMILVFHFKRIKLAALMLGCLTLCLFGTATGLLVTQTDFSVTCVLGIVALMGILVRNGIIMFDYADELRTQQNLRAAEAIKQSAKRRMRPIFLTSAAASMGVIPMIISQSGLWMPMGIVICFGTMITMLFILTVIPVAYSYVIRTKDYVEDDPDMPSEFEEVRSLGSK